MARTGPQELTEARIIAKLGREIVSQWTNWMTFDRPGAQDACADAVAAMAERLQRTGLA